MTLFWAAFEGNRESVRKLYSEAPCSTEELVEIFNNSLINNQISILSLLDDSLFSDFDISLLDSSIIRAVVNQRMAGADRIQILLRRGLKLSEFI